MPTDDDYGRRERLLLHQSGQYGQPASPLRGSSGSTASSGTGKSSSSTSSTTSSSSHDGQYSRQPISQSLLGGEHSRYSRYEPYQQLSSVCDRSHAKKSNSSGGGSEYANSSVLIGGPASGSVANPFSTETFLPSPPSPAPAGSDRFVPPPPLSPSVSDKYSSSQSLANYHPADRLMSAGSASAQQSAGQQGVSASGKEQRFSSTDRLLAADAKDQQRGSSYSGSSTERLLASASPVLGVLSERCGYGSSSLKDSVSSSGSSSGSIRYGISSTERLLTSSPIHAPVPEKFANNAGGTTGGSYFKDSPLHERYHHQQQQQASSGSQQHYGGCSASERYSPNPEGARYSSSERILAGGEQQQIASNRRYSTDQALEAACQKYADSRASPGPTEFTSSRYQGYQDAGSQRYGASAAAAATTADRFNDLALQRYAQNRPTDRFVASNERYLSSTGAVAHDVRQSGGCELNRYVKSLKTFFNNFFKSNLSLNSLKT